MQIRATAAAGIEPATWPRTIRKSPSGQIPSASPGEIGELRRPAEAWTLPIFDTKLAAGPTPTTTTAITTAAAIRATQRWRAIAARAALKSIGRRPAISSRPSQIGRASANQTRPGRL